MANCFVLPTGVHCFHSYAQPHPLYLRGLIRQGGGFLLGTHSALLYLLLLESHLRPVSSWKLIVESKARIGYRRELVKYIDQPRPNHSTIEYRHLVVGTPTHKIQQLLLMLHHALTSCVPRWPRKIRRWSTVTPVWLPFSLVFLPSQLPAVLASLDRAWALLCVAWDLCTMSRRCFTANGVHPRVPGACYKLLLCMSA